jgi:methylenetetrahydrofolate dehydrogenase (NADP+) / methenyltetrahydrofolate cyclohydrolase
MTSSQTVSSAAQVLKGKEASQALLQQVSQQLEPLKAKGLTPTLRVVQVGDVAASSVYVRKKAEMAKKLGLDGQVLALPANISQEALLAELEKLNADASVHAVLLQLPLSAHLDALACQMAIAPQKDVDGFHPENLGRLLSGAKPFALPCTPAGVMWLLDYYKQPLAGKHAVVVGRSNIVGKPMAHLLLQQNATVTIAHSRTQNLEQLLALADVVVAALGIPEFIKGSSLKAGAVVIDVGINRLEDGRLVGDVDYASALPVVSAITPVPGGIGPMTIAMLMANTVKLCALQNNVSL